MDHTGNVGANGERFRGDTDYGAYLGLVLTATRGYPDPMRQPFSGRNSDAIAKNIPPAQPMKWWLIAAAGCITRTLLTDAGTTLWLEDLGHPRPQPDDHQSKHS